MSSQQGQNKGEMPVAEAVRLADLVNYQEGSVVSRTIVKRATGTVTSIRPRSTPWHIYWRAKRKLRWQASHFERRQAKEFSCRQTNLTL